MVLLEKHYKAYHKVNHTTCEQCDKLFHAQRHLHNHNLSFQEGNIICSIIVVTNHHDSRSQMLLLNEYLNNTLIYYIEQV